MSRDMNCVYRAASVEEADIVVAWLVDRGISALVRDRHAIGTLNAPPAVAPKGIAVCVLNEEQAELAKMLLAEHTDELKKNRAHIQPGKVFRVVCEECGRASDFPSELYGSVQNCPICRANMDVIEPPQVC